jgi:hypothetical protein
MAGGKIPLPIGMSELSFRADNDQPRFDCTRVAL